MDRSLFEQKFGFLVSFFVALTIAFSLGCTDPQITETSMFESAEVHYRQGNYDDALSGYQAFLRHYPTSPLATTAEMRVRNIQREVSSMMERSGSPRPVYHGSRMEQSASVPESISQNGADSDQKIYPDGPEQN